MSQSHDIKSGDIISYPYLWMREQLEGEDSGRKHRPCAIAIVIELDVYLLAITTKRPDAREGIEVPETEKRRAGLDGSRRQWIVVSEYNYDDLSMSYYIEPGSKMGRLSSQFMKQVKAAFVAELKSKRVERVNRTD